MNVITKNNDLNEFVPKSFSEIIDNFFKENATPATGKVIQFLPATDITEDVKNYEIQLALPGLKKEEIKIEVLDGKLSVSGERLLKREENKKYHTVGTKYGTFFKSFFLPENANAENISAEFIDGILKIVIPKDEKRIAKTTITVK